MTAPRRGETGQAPGAWDKFFCSTCQTERLIQYRTRFGKHNMPKCTFCLERRAHRKDEPKPFQVYEDYERPSLPEYVLDAYREANAD